MSKEHLEDGEVPSNMEPILRELQDVLRRHEATGIVIACHDMTSAYAMHFNPQAMFAGLESGEQVAIELPVQKQGEALATYIRQQMGILRTLMEHLSTLHLSCTTLQDAVVQMLREDEKLAALVVED